MTEPSNVKQPEYPYGAFESNGFTVGFPSPDPSNDRHIALGQFMDAWSRLERAMRETFWILSGTNYQIAQTIMAAQFDAQRSRELLMALGKLRLEPKNLLTLQRLCKRMGRQATWRNRLVHGEWAWACVAQGQPVGPPTITGKWMRTYNPIDPDAARRSRTDPGTKEAYHFDVARILVIACVVHNVANDFKRFWPVLAKASGRNLQPEEVTRIPDE